MGIFNSSWFARRDEALPPMAMTGLDKRFADADERNSPPPRPTLAGDPVWVIFASETGVAEQLARDSCRALQDAGVAAGLLSFEELDPGKLRAMGHALFLVSTCYDGDPPDMAEEFCRKYMREPTRLPQLRYGMLALGDSYYDEFCGFGRKLYQWLQASGAQTLFEPIEMDDEDEIALRSWHDRLHSVVQRRLAGGSPAA